VLLKESLAQIPIAHYNLDNNSTDISGNNNNGKLIGGVSVTTDRFGNPCGALNFNGIDSYIEVPNSVSLQSLTYTFSVTCWFKIENVPLLKDIKWLTLICKGNQTVESNSNPQFRLQTFQSAMQSTISINSDFTEYDNNFYKHVFEFGKWNFYALVYDGTTVRTYLDNNKIWEFPYSKSLVANVDPMHIGKDAPGSLEFFCGSLDDIRIFNTSLTDAEIFKIYKDDSFASVEDEYSLICPANITTYTDKDNCTAIVNYPQPELKENCGSVTLKQILGLASGSQFKIGSSFISYEASSKSGYKKTCLTKITVIDKDPPIINCPNDTTVIISDTSMNAIDFLFQIPTATDKCSQAQVTLLGGVPSSLLFPIGTTQLQFRATDESGNSVDCSYNVIVKRKFATVITSTPIRSFHYDSLMCPADIEKINDSQRCGAVVYYSINQTNNEISLVEGQKSGTFFPVGTTVNKYSIGNSKNECTFNVNITDEEKPELSCPADIFVYVAGGQLASQVSFDAPSVSDNCSIDSLIQLNGIISGALFPLGTTQNIYKAVDVFGNYSTCSFNITVIDTNARQMIVDSVELKPNLISDSIRYSGKMDFNACIITVIMYDDSEQDYDSISVFYNGREIVRHEMIKLRQNGTINRALMLIEGERNDLVVKAWNVGKTFPNTLQVDFYEGYYLDKVKVLKNKKPDMKRTLHSKPGLAAGLYLYCKN
jgi:hypothetical protein